MKCQLFEFVGLSEPTEGDIRYNQYVDSFGKLYRYADLSFGAMFFNPECRAKDCKGPDRGGCLSIKVPSRADKTDHGQFFQVDHPMFGSNTYWVRSGEAPNITVMPSILNSGGWHGWVRDGELVDV